MIQESYKFILSDKAVPDLLGFHNLIKKNVPCFIGINKIGSVIEIELALPPTQDIIDTIENIEPPAIPNNQIKSIVGNAIAFGTSLMVEFAAENVAMGITQDGMTNHVRKAVSEVTNCLMTGSLYDAIAEIRGIPVEMKDPKYLTDVRLLAFINKIEDYLGIPRSTTL